MNAPSGSTSSVHTGNRKRKRRVAGTMEENALMGMVEATKEIAPALKPQKYNHRQLPDMTDDNVYDDIELLGPDPQLAEMFFAFEEDGSRKARYRRSNRKNYKNA